MTNAFKDIKVELNFFEPILGSLPADKEIYSKYILGKLEEQGIVMPDSKKDQELDSIDPQEEIDNKVTVYPRNEDGQVCFWDYQIRGFFKGSCGMLRMVPGTESSKLKNYKKKIDGLVFVQERMVPIEYEGDIDIYQRPLRAQTMQGDRVALAMSERVPKGAKVQFTIRLFDPELAAAVYEWLDYGRYNGIGQFRNGSFGRFTWRDISDTPEKVEDAPVVVEKENEEKQPEISSNAPKKRGRPRKNA